MDTLLEEFDNSAEFDDMLTAFSKACGKAVPDVAPNARAAKPKEVWFLFKGLIALLRSRDSEIETLKKRVNELETKAATTTTGTRGLFSDIVAGGKGGNKRSEEDNNVLNAVLHETMEQKKSAKNVVIFGLTESTKSEATDNSRRQGCGGESLHDVESGDIRDKKR